MEDMDMDAGPSTSKDQKQKVDEDEDDNYGGVSDTYLVLNFNANLIDFLSYR